MRKVCVILSVLAMAVFALACAITDYDGIGNHKTSGDAKLWGKEVAFTGTGPDLGTYSYVVSYDNTGGSGKVRIDSLINADIVSFSRDGVVDRDGDDVQGSPGDAGGRFLPQFVSIDNGPGCQFFDNITQDKSDAGAAVALCITGGLEEVDNHDQGLSASFRSLDSLLKQVWSGALSGEFTLEVTGVRINGVSYPVDTLNVGARTTALSVGRMVIDLSQPAAASVIQALLDNTSHGVGVSAGLDFAGGLSVDLPSNVTVAFNHDALGTLLN